MQESNYEIVIGLEVHAQLLTNSKLFCGDAIAYGASPNTQVSPITLGHPGTLPRMNRKAIEYAIKIGLVCHCEIEQRNYFARKNYFYPDLPKGYQISQHTTPICKNGYVSIGNKAIRLNRIHLEEDAGKSIHDIDDTNSCIDYNRAGTPLIEIVSEPDLRSADETVAYLTELRKMVRYLGICDGNMEEGSFRCDVNISVRRRGDEQLGTKVEIKNLNSIRNAKRAVEFESDRLMKMLEQDQMVIQQTRGFDATNGTTFAIRDKEDADDYRYFADPDLTPFVISDEYIESIRATLPAMQQERIQLYISRWGLSEYDARILTEEKELADYFEDVVKVHNGAGTRTPGDKNASRILELDGNESGAENVSTNVQLETSESSVEKALSIKGELDGNESIHKTSAKHTAVIAELDGNESIYKTSAKHTSGIAELDGNESGEEKINVQRRDFRDDLGAVEIKGAKSIANWLQGPVKSWMNDNESELTLTPQQLSSLINLVDEGKLSFSVASSKVLPLLMGDSTADPIAIAEKQNLFQQSDAGSIEPIIDEVLTRLSDKVSEYKKGKKGLLSLFVGEVMKKSKGKADPKITNTIILEKLKS